MVNRNRSRKKAHQKPLSSWPLGNLREGIYNLFVLLAKTEKYVVSSYMPHCFSLFHSFVIYFSLKILFPQKNYHSTRTSFSPGQVVWPGHVCSGITLMVAVISGEHQGVTFGRCHWGINNCVTTINNCVWPAAPNLCLESLVVPVAPVHHLNVVWHISLSLLAQRVPRCQLLLWLHHFVF